MASDVQTGNRMRCTRCEKVDQPRLAGAGPGWIAIALWGATLVAWVVAWYVMPIFVVFWVVLLAALLYTLWYFFKRENACRHCGCRILEPAGETG